MIERRKIRFPISAKMILLFLLVCTLLISIQSTVNFIYMKSYIMNRIFSDIKALSDDKAHFITTLVEEDFEDVRDVVGRITMRESLAELESGVSDPEKPISKILESIEAVKEATGHIIRNVDIIGLDGKIAASTIPGNRGKDMAKSPFFIRGRTEIYLSDPYPAKGTFEYMISAPIFGLKEKGGELIGVAMVQINADRLCGILTDAMGLGKTAETVLGKRAGNELIFFGMACYRLNPDFQLRIPIDSKLAVPMRYATERKEGVIMGPDYRGTEVLAAYQYLHIAGWGLVVKVDTKEAFAPIKGLFLWIILTDSILFLLSALTIINFTRFISKPLKELRDGTREIGSGDLEYRVKANTSDEIGELAGAFNEMTENLQKITVSHDKLNKEVEERKRAEGRLAQALRAKSDFTSMVSHELRTPLAAIKEGINIILDGVVGDASKDQKEYLNIAKTNVDRLTRLINDILDFQKLESGKMDLKFAENDISKVAQEVYDTMRPLTEQQGIDFAIKVEENLPRIIFDRDRIVQVLTNLVNNAIKFTKKGAIGIAVTKEKTAVHVTVRDSGVGIRKDDMTRLFKSFEQLEEAIERKGGTGLGLAISKEIIERHHGRIWVESEFGKGTAMHFILPVPDKVQ